ncbi:POT family domain-containing protein [Ditylenchus destructor]|uniref:POT family domain-containing protein n=1 Tax=Ditylenchus destructor TaxID=166010 RepID=A0AAD4MQS6_9BILA|nr:POT family domain-containing protein [Ditylenchus destructor]
MGLHNHDDLVHPVDKKLDNMTPSKLAAAQRRKPKPKMAETWPEMIRAWPKTTLCIVSNEFCERFSYYGMRTILLLYFLNVLKADYSIAIVGANGFSVLCYLMPLPGSILADGYIGKFRTIFILSIVYAFGQVCLALASTLSPGSPFHPYVDIAGLVIIAMGTGGIKPCVASFGADQFEPHQGKMISLFFSVFYFALNAGSMISTFVSPIFRAQSCLDQDSCYPLAFGIPAILMVIATVFFTAGSPWYKKHPPKENVFGEVYRATKAAIVNKSRGKSQVRDHWLDTMILIKHRNTEIASLSDQDSCYPLAFGIPAILMVIATVFFTAGSPWYKKPPPRENVFGEVYRATKAAIVNKSRGKSQVRDHWLDYYMDTHDCERDPKCMQLQQKKRDKSLCQKKTFIEDIKSLLRVLIMYLPAPMFWALYDQQGSSWTIQAVQMKSRFSSIFGEIMLFPDQMQTVNAVLILAFIPIFQFVIYPIAGMCVKLTPLRKMVAGGLLTTLAFTTLPDLPSEGNGYVSIMNGFDKCNITVAVKGNTNISPVNLGANMTLVNDNTKSDPKERRQMFELPAGDTTFSISYIGSDCHAVQLNLPAEVTYKVVDGATTYLFVGPLGTFYSRASTKKPVEGNGEFSLGIDLASENEYSGHLALCRKDTESTTKEHPCDPRRNSDFVFYLKGEDTIDEEGNKATSPVCLNQFCKTVLLNYSCWRLYEMYNVPKKAGQLTMSKEEVKVRSMDVEIEVQGQGGVYLMVLAGTKDKPSKHIFQSVSDNLIPIYWQIPQIAIITAAEILFAITGYEFAYSQAAPSMKSLVQGIWLLSTAGGDAIIVAIALMRINNLAYVQLLYGGMMLVTMIVFALMSIFYYKYNYYTGDDSSEFDYLDLEAEDLAVDVPNDGLNRSISMPKAVYGGTDNAHDKIDPEHNWQDRF